ncbi:MAG: hypothetical protein KDE58_16370, partial [Caldilineaceae bacterium]|nr:hypothetical protein [Caldilineaceae bacterium]
HRKTPIYLCDFYGFSLLHGVDMSSGSAVKVEGSSMKNVKIADVATGKLLGFTRSAAYPPIPGSQAVGWLCQIGWRYLLGPVGRSQWAEVSGRINC